MMPDKPIRMFIYQPFYTKDKAGKKEYLHTKTYRFPYYPAKKGDRFTGEKRVQDFVEMQNHSTCKVVAVRYNYIDCTCGVVLEDKIIEKKEEPKEEPEKNEESMEPVLMEPTPAEPYPKGLTAS